MKYSILTTLLLITGSFYNLTAQKISSKDYNKYYIHEDFNKVSENFKVVTSNDNYFVIDKGDYLLSRNNNKSEYAIIADNSTVSDFVLQTVIRIGPSENQNASLGVILKAQNDGKGAVVFSINKKGEYRIKQLVDNTYNILSKSRNNNGWIKSKLINKVDEHNLIEVRSKNNIYDVYINSKYLTTFSTPDLDDGSCGLLISAATKARVSYFYINLKGKNNVSTDYTNNQPKSKNDQVLNKRIQTLEEKNTDLANISVNQEKEILRLNQENNDLQLEKENIAKLQQINIKHKNDLNNKDKEITDLNKKINKLKIENKNIDKLNKINNEQKSTIKKKESEIQDLHQKINLKKVEISELNKKNIDLSSVTIQQEKSIKEIQNSLKDIRFAENKASKNNKDLTEKVSKLDKQVKTEKKENSSLKNEVKKANTQLNLLKETQAKHDKVTTDLNSQITELTQRIQELTDYLNAANEKNAKLENRNEELKELFILKDFELNGIKPSEIAKENTNNIKEPKILTGNTTFYSVQFGVFMQQQENNSMANIGNVFFDTTEQGSYIYYSGEFNLPEEAAAHMQELISKGYTNSFVVTLTK